MKTRLDIILETVRNIMEIGEIAPLSSHMSSRTSNATSRIRGDKGVDTTGVAQGQKSSTGLGMNTNRPSSGGAPSSSAGVAQGQRSSTGLGMNSSY